MSLHAFTASRELHTGVEAICRYDEVTPRAEDSGSIAVAARRATDVKNLTFPLQVVLGIIGAVVATTLSVTGAFWIVTSTIRTDIAVIRQGQSDQVKIDEYKAKLEEANRQLFQQSIEQVKADLNAVRGQVQLANIEISNVRRELTERQTGVRK